MKKYVVLLIILLSGCSSNTWEDQLRIMDEVDETAIQNQFITPEHQSPLRFSATTLGLTDYNVYSDKEATEKFPNYTWELKTIPLGENAAILDDERPLYFYSENRAKHMTYKYALKKEELLKVKKQIPENDFILAWIDDEHNAIYECEKEHNYKYDERCGYGAFDRKENQGGQGSRYSREYDEDIDQKSVQLRQKIAQERKERELAWKASRKEGKNMKEFAKGYSEINYAFLPSEYHYYCKKRQSDYFYHCKIKFNLNLLIGKPK